MKKLFVFLLIAALFVMAGCSADGPLEDGQYTVEVQLSGGTGRAGVESPASLTIKEGEMTAVVIWSSPFYEFMVVGGETYYPIQTEGNATFEIPVVLDEDMAVSAQTVAMSQPFHRVLPLPCKYLWHVQS